MVMRLAPLALLAALLFASTALAQFDPTAEARAHFDAGRAHARSERWADALAEFRASDALLPRAVTEFNVASALVRLGRAREALAVLDALDARTDADASLRADAATLRTVARGALRTLTLSVVPADARIEIDGEVATATGSQRTLTLDPGEHTLVASASGHVETRVVIPAEGTTLALSLDALPGTLAVEPTPVDASVSIDGAAVGVGRVEREVRAGSHHVRAEASGYAPFELDVEVGAGQRALVPAMLGPAPSAPSLAEDPVLWIVIGSVLLVGAGVGIGVGVATNGSGESPYGGTSGVVLASLASF